MTAKAFDTSPPRPPHAQRLYPAGAATKIYERAGRLAQLGYPAAEKRPGKTRERTYYTLTPKGLTALRSLAAGTLSVPPQLSPRRARPIPSPRRRSR